MTLQAPDEVIACPYCGFLARRHTFLSLHTGIRSLWSDAREYPPSLTLLGLSPALTRCYGCKRFYWVDEAEVKGEIKPQDMLTELDWRWNFFVRHFPQTLSEDLPQEWKDAKPVRALTIDEYIEALDAGVGSDTRKERYLRMHFWWEVNDFVRKNDLAKYAEYAQKLRENLVRLFALLDEREPNERIMKAEIAREMGDFTQAIRLLEDVPAEFRQTADSIMKWAKEKDSQVRPLPLGDQPRKKSRKR